MLNPAPNEVGIYVGDVGAGILETPMTEKFPCKWHSYIFRAYVQYANELDTLRPSMLS